MSSRFAFMRSRRIHCIPSLALIAILSIVSSLLGIRPSLAQDGGSEARGEVVLSKLPPRGSKAYKELLGLAGKDANGQILGFTQAEVWSMPRSRIEGVIRQGESLGVT